MSNLNGNIENEICFLSENDSRHAIKVLRLKKNHRIAIVNGKGILGKAEIFEANPKKTKIKVKIPPQINNLLHFIKIIIQILRLLTC